MLHEETLNKALAFAKKGGRVAFVGSLPSQTPQQGESATVTQDAKELLASVPECTFHAARLDDFDDLVGWMVKKVPPSLHWNGPSCVRMMRRQEPGRDILLVANPSAEDAEGHLTTKFAGEVSLWNPETGVVDNLGWRISGQAIDLNIPADSARFIVFERGAN